MKTVYVLYNPMSGKGAGEAESKKIKRFHDYEIVYIDVIALGNYAEFFNSLTRDDAVIVAGGDGTLNRFANDIADMDINNPVFYYATGSGNDFLNDLDRKKGGLPFRINEYVENTPVMDINGEKYNFVNGVGGGLDAYACVEGNKQHKKGKSGNYVLSAIKGILYDYKPMKARIVVDGKEYNFTNVWFASVMKGRYFGGGIMLAPAQDRGSGKLSVVVVHTVGRIGLLTIVPGAFSGKHVKYKQYVEVIEGENITVEFDRHVDVQYDGETLPDVINFSVKANDSKIMEEDLIS